MSEPVNIIKLCVGAEKVEDLQAWQDSQRGRAPAGRAIHITRMFPKRVEDVIGGSLFWVFKGMILARQEIVDLQEVVGSDGIRRCAFVLDAKIHRTEPAPRRPFQGWRYLEVKDSPRDMPDARPDDDDLPPALAAALSEIGLR